jgi:aryl-alcohol dehydrogenase-like predicted oxidoreductase
VIGRKQIQFKKTNYDATADSDRLLVERVAERVENHDVPRAHLALAWLLQKETVTAPIVSTTKISHLEGAVAAPGFDNNGRNRILGRTVCTELHNWS